MSLETKQKLTEGLLDGAWMYGRDLADPLVVEEIATAAGLDGKRAVQEAQQNVAIKNALREETDKAIAKGVFGVPSVAVNEEIFWGSDTDTLRQVEDHALGRDALDLDVLKKWQNLPYGSRRNV
mmetsp:Transcript_1531/g.2530  ORF Transcript_1531/g.2530 Transcript_1531/m.2530 type:complete len:124 (-) Transcript_1531:139-510(-)